MRLFDIEPELPHRPRMQESHEPELDLGIEKTPVSHRRKTNPLTISASAGKVLSPAQVEFNKHMKALEKARASHERERARLEGDLCVCHSEFMPLVERKNRSERDLIVAAAQAHQSMKLTPKRRKWLGDLISGKCSDLLGDPAGLAESDIQRLETLIQELGPSFIDQEREDEDLADLEFFRDLMEDMARKAGVDLDLGDIDIHSDPAEFEQMLQEKLEAAGKDFQNMANGEGPPHKKPRKPTKAALERERLRQEMEDAKKRDIKSLYKQLAKVLHPDLETDPTLKAHKEAWMKRLTSAHANRDLRDMLAIEMEWLGEEASKLAAASDEKLRIYAMVLKEQLAELKEQTRMLHFEPQYQILMRFAGPFGIRQSPTVVKSALIAEINRLDEMSGIIRTGSAQARTIVQQWADAHARVCRR